MREPILFVLFVFVINLFASFMGKIWGTISVIISTILTICLTFILIFGGGVLHVNVLVFWLIIVFGIIWLGWFIGRYIRIKIIK